MAQPIDPCHPKLGYPIGPWRPKLGYPIGPGMSWELLGRFVGQSWGFQLIQTAPMTFSMRSDTALCDLLQPVTELDFTWPLAAELVVYSLPVMPVLAIDGSLQICVIEPVAEVSMPEKAQRRRNRTAEDVSCF